MAVDFFQFVCQYLIAGFILGLVQMKLAARNSDAAKALAFIRG